MAEPRNSVPGINVGSDNEGDVGIKGKEIIFPSIHQVCIVVYTLLWLLSNPPQRT